MPWTAAWKDPAERARLTTNGRAAVERHAGKADRASIPEPVLHCKT
ncbi:hypothetical protein [Thiocystis minor]|nr:hypothetical protein [Thiocystis minor]